MDTLSEGNGTFALNLLKKLAENNSKNIYFSPMSILSSLAMVLLGTKGNTAAQISQALCFSKIRDGDEDIHQGFQLLLTEVNKGGTQYLLRTANRLFGEMSYDVLSNEKKPVQMMFNVYTFKTTYIGEIFTQILVLPDVGKELNMIIVLPDENTNLEMVEKELSYEKFIEWARPGKMYEDEMEVFLPRFKLEESYDMEDVLHNLGMTDAFEEERADFSGMSPKNGLYLSRIIHKSFVEVSEEGTEAAAVTTITMVPT